MREPIDVDLLTRVEGEGSIHLRFGADGLDAVEFRIGEAPRMFEALLVGRSMHEVPDIVARICGICPVAHQVTACLALEAGAEVEVPEATRRLRDLLYLGEWISSHALHLFLLEVPDHLGVPDVFHLARDNPLNRMLDGARQVVCNRHVMLASAVYACYRMAWMYFVMR